MFVFYFILPLIKTYHLHLPDVEFAIWGTANADSQSKGKLTPVCISDQSNEEKLAQKTNTFYKKGGRMNSEKYHGLNKLRSLF